MTENQFQTQCLFFRILAPENDGIKLVYYGNF